MLRAILSVIAGYATMFIVTFVTFTCAFLIMGMDRAYEPGTYDVSMLWIVVSVILGTIAAILGGIVCAAIARTGGPPKALAALVVVLGVLMAIIAIMTGPDSAPEARPADVSVMDAMMQSKQPAWALLTNPLIGAVGVLIGAGCCRKKGAAGASAA